MTKVQKLKIIFLLSIFYFLFSFPVSASELSLSAKKADFQPGEEFLVSIFLNTENESINALEGKIVFPVGLLELREIRDGNSLITFWLERPKTSNGEIVFSGIIPGGYFDKKGLVLDLVFQTKQIGSGSIILDDGKVLLNDGQGTIAPLTISNFQFLISKQTASPQITIPEVKDSDPPEIFTPVIAQDPTMFNGQYFLVFATQDKGSGIDYYEVREGWGQFIRAISPYLLLNQRLDKKITVRAVDKAGNVRLAVLTAPNPWPLYQKIILSAIIIIVIGLICFWGGRLWRKIKQKRR